MKRPAKKKLLIPCETIRALSPEKLCGIDATGWGEQMQETTAGTGGVAFQVRFALD